jgi:hypothetical protein
MVNGTTCFGCAGKGVKLTKRGRAAQEYLDNLRKIAVADVVVGMRIKTDIATFTVASIGEDHRMGVLRSKTGDVPIIHRPFTSVGGKTYWESLSGTAMIMVSDEMREKALAFQATLTKTSTVRKGKVTEEDLTLIEKEI